jgi:hypothetical protein
MQKQKMQWKDVALMNFEMLTFSKMESIIWNELLEVAKYLEEKKTKTKFVRNESDVDRIAEVLAWFIAAQVFPFPGRVFAPSRCQA